MTPERLTEIQVYAKHLTESGQLVGGCLRECLEEIARLKEKAEMWESIAKEWLHEIHRKPELDDVRKFNVYVRIPGYVGIEHAKPGEYWIDLDMMADRIKVTDGLEIVPAAELARLRSLSGPA